VDGGDWALLISLVGCGAVAYVAIDRYESGRLWVPNLQGRVKVLGRAGFGLAFAGFVGLVVWAVITVPQEGEQAPSIEPDATVPTWAVLSIVAFAAGAVLATIAIVLGRRRVPTGHPDARAHRARR
jgi:hypothetical protein